jgi:hypothetical protein
MMELKGNIKNNVMFPIHTRSAHNFVGINLARRPNIFVHPVLDIKVIVLDGKKN